MSDIIMVHRTGKKFQLLNVFNRIPSSSGPGTNGTYVLFSLKDGTIRKVDEKSIGNYTIDVRKKPEDETGSKA